MIERTALARSHAVIMTPLNVFGMRLIRSSAALLVPLSSTTLRSVILLTCPRLEFQEDIPLCLKVPGYGVGCFASAPFVPGLPAVPDTEPAAGTDVSTVLVSTTVEIISTMMVTVGVDPTSLASAVNNSHSTQPQPSSLSTESTTVSTSSLSTESQATSSSSSMTTSASTSPLCWNELWAALLPCPTSTSFEAVLSTGTATSAAAIQSGAGVALLPSIAGQLCLGACLLMWILSL